MSIGKITQIIGAVIDVEFPSDSIPKVYNALHVTKANLTLEVQQQLGDNVVRAIAMGGSEGLQRGLEVTNTGKSITVPVGTKTLGRIMNVLGEPIDNAGAIKNLRLLNCLLYGVMIMTINCLNMPIKSFKYNCNIC